MRKHDDIEKAFKEQFDNPDDQGWNVPADDVWGKIDASLGSATKKKSRYGILILCSFVMILGLSIVGYQIIYVDTPEYSTNQVQSQEKEMFSGQTNFVNNEQTRKVKVSRENVQLSEVQVLQKSSNSAQRLANVSIPTRSEITTAPSVYRTEVNLTDQRFIGNESIDQNQGRTSVSPASSLNTILADESALIDTRKINDAIGLNTISSFVTNMQAVELITPETIEYETPEKAEEVRKQAIHIATSVAAPNLYERGSQTSSLSELIGREYAESQIGLSISYEMDIDHKWSISTGVAVSRQSYITEYDLALPYDPSLEVSDGSSAHIDFNHSLPTTFGQTETSLRLLRSDAQDPLLDETVVLDFNTRHKLTSIAIPTSIAYRFSRNISTGLSASPQYIVAAESSISSVVSYHSQINSVRNSSNSDFDQLNRFNLGVGAFVNFDFPISGNHGLRASLFANTNLFSHFSTDDYNARSQSAGGTVGYYFQF